MDHLSDLLGDVFDAMNYTVPNDFLASPLIEWAGFVLRLLTLVFTLTFVVRYSRRPWRSLPEGRHLMGFSLTILAFMVVSVFNNIMAWIDPHSTPIYSDGAYPGRQLVVFILYGFSAWFMFQRNMLLNPESDARDELQALNDLHDDRIPGQSSEAELSDAVRDLASAVRDDEPESTKES